MNSKVCKRLRTIAFSNTPAKEERKNRQWAIIEDKKHHKLLVCLDPRAIYKMMKKNFRDANPPDKLKMRAEIKAISIQKKKEFPRGIFMMGQISFLGRLIGGMNVAPRRQYEENIKIFKKL